MRARRVYAVVIGVGVLVGLLVWGARREREPEYGGKRLSQWVLQLPGNTSPEGNSEAEEAVRHIGTNSLPYLLKWISYDPAPWRLKLYEVGGKFLNRGPNVLLQDKNMLRAAGSARAFGALGPKADAAKDELRRLTCDFKRGMSRVYAAFAMEAQHTEELNGPYSIFNVTVFSAGDAFTLAYPTNGVNGGLILTVSHTNSPPAMPPTPNGPAAVESNASRGEKTGHKVE